MIGQNHQNRNIGKQVALFAGAMLLAGAVVMQPHGDLHAFGTVPRFLVGAAVMLVGFYVGVIKPPGIAVFWVVAVGTRVILLWQLPGGDIYRYIWEGRNLLLGWNPYVFAPESDALQPLRDALWEKVQHKGVTAIYPPLAQWMFAGMAVCVQAPMFFKTVFMFADLVVAGLLVRAFGVNRAVVYAWNPLVIYSFAGGGHYDSIFVLAMVLGWQAWRRGWLTLAAFWLGVATGLKWISLPLLGWVLWRVMTQVWRRDVRINVLALSLLAAVAPMGVAYVAMGVWTGNWLPHMLPAKFSQVARSAEFLPAIVAAFWKQSAYSNAWLVVPVAVGWAAIILLSRRWISSAERLLAWTYVWSPLVHAWYFVWTIPFAVVSRNAGVLALSASGFVYFLLYHHVEAAGGQWRLTAWQTAWLWLPFVIGFAWSEWRYGRKNDVEAKEPTE